MFPLCVVSGCNFHFQQCLWREVQRLGMVTEYRDFTEVRRHIRMCAALAYLPPENVDDGWLSIMEASPVSENICKFNDYMIEQWLENAIFTDTWNCYQQRHRTTNALEGWHSKFNKCVQKVHPNIIELISLLKSDSRHYDIQRSRARLNIPAKKRSKKYNEIDNIISKTLRDFCSGHIDYLY